MDLKKEIEKILKDNLAIYGRPEHRGIKDEATDQLLALFDSHTRSVIGSMAAMLDLGDEIVDEARPHYEDDDNEIYTIIDWNMNAQKLRKVYKLKSYAHKQRAKLSPRGKEKAK